MGWQVLCVIPLVVGMVAYLARRYWLAGRLTRHSMEPQGRILLPSVAVIVIDSLLACSGWIGEARFALSRGAFERAVRYGETFDDRSGEGWIGLYKVHAIQVDKFGRTAFNLGDCYLFAQCDLEFDAKTPCKSRGWRESWAADAHWCVVIHDYF
jgi:hypothetical protein